MNAKHDMNPLVYVVTLNCNRSSETLAFLASCSRSTYFTFRILVVDNASSDQSVNLIASRFPDVILAVNSQNLGFTGGSNLGIRMALGQGAEYVFLVNNDTLLEPDALKFLVDGARSLQADLAMPAIYYAAEPQRPWSLGGMRNPLTLEIIPCKAPDNAAGEPLQSYEVDYVSGCAMLIHKSCIEKIGFFDEDSDYSLRAKAAGCRLIVVPQARMWHKVGVIMGARDSPAERYYMARSSVYFFRKHTRGWRWMVVLPYRLLSGMKILLRLLIKRRWLASQSYLRGLWDGLR